ncbi:MAG: ribonuclease P protein component [Elusimicrobiales bacterium]|nr:ribonuclease P protein component [Elusimicrobiales bacterium]
MKEKRYLLSRIRLKTERCFKEIYSRGKKVQFGFGIIYFLEFSNKDEFKFAVLVSKKCGNVPERNRIKRLVREFFRLNQHNIKNSHIVLKLYKNPEFKGYKDAQEFLKQIFQKNNFIINH